ncbi:MAG: fibronectin type III domain-containing protein [bacterium]
MLLAVLFLTAPLQAQQSQDYSAADSSSYMPPLSPPAEVRAYDTPDDAGGSITVEWEPSADDTGTEGRVTGYEIFRSESRDSGFESLMCVPGGTITCIDNSALNRVQYYYRVRAFSADAPSAGALAGPAMASQQWFNRARVNLMVIACILVFAIVYYIVQSARGKDLYIRKISGLEAVDEAVGRATEMGRPVLFVPGIQDMDNVQTVAGITILANIAKRTATYETALDVPVSRSIVMSTGRETVKQAYLESGRPDLYNDDIVHYITDEQFGYVAAVDGIMVRQKPAACFYLGAFFAESLILAETGNSIGAIQVAGTAMPTQLPFFVAACDYTLIGEELFAASAYLSGDRMMLGSLKGQDSGKAIAMLFILVGVGLATLAAISGSEALTTLSEWMRYMFRVN